MERIDEIVMPERSGNDNAPISPQMREALTYLLEALKAKNFDMVDSSLARLQALPLAGKIREAASAIAGFILTADLQKAADIATALLGRRD
jgi:hypothetical protein